MTVELAVTLPVLLTVAVIAVNALLVLSECSAFDRLAHIAIRAHAVSPAYGQTDAQNCSIVEQQLGSAFDKPYEQVSVSCASAGAGFACYTATLTYHPTLFGMGLRDEVFGVALPTVQHVVSYVIEPYRPGVLI